ncbi:hypothetical protein CC1G_04294 [Coprinopsis cinerea okayama7|uniref:Uncharacterized protein n=1 Tax=Coprinopsis cinerea (strain Okayama-7 / 130 / ATCC MYA-4618 / FGSC 9003) TaxID=240176 RepID=A8NFL4_COPC7|nr:hypothetical protein CC1G_04294 [Coprinopsis cinerea okayama7\|eukprot:XP_001833315.1 hypothetical protein CC1G_04294 [Coprinopsis cinerea okayama7\
MSLNDTNMLAQSGRSSVYPGIANPTAANDNTPDPRQANFVNDPTSEAFGAGASPSSFSGHRDAKNTLKQQAGVVEARPGIIESTNIDPLNENSNKEDGWANATKTPGNAPTKGIVSGITTQATEVARGAANTATGAAKVVYGTVVGDEQTKQVGREAIYGKH